MNDSRHLVANLSTVTLPNNSLFSTNPNPSAGYLIETNPRFANYRTWLSSDYMLSQLNLDPTYSLKRLGDGFYEQKLIREQINQLTGRRFLLGYANDEAQYQALMQNGVTSAKQFNLQPGIALSAGQVAQLTSDMVWLVEQTVTLPAQYDSTGKLTHPASTTQALVPHVYVVVKAGDLNEHGQLLSGALISADSTQLNMTGDLNNDGTLTNSGTIAGRTVLALNANNLNNLGGRLTATDVNVHANNDLNNLGGQIDATNSLTASAGHDLNVISTTSTQSNAHGSTTNINRVAGLYVTGNPSLPTTGLLVASAGNDMHIDGAQIVNNGISNNSTGASSTTQLNAGHDLTIGTVASNQQSQLTWNSKNTLSENSTQDHGSNIQTAGDISLHAGQDLNLKAATINSSQGNLNADAGRNLTIATGQSTANSVGATSYGYGTTNSTATATTQGISSLGAANNINLQSGADTHLTSAKLNAGKAIDVVVTGNLTVDAAKDTSKLDYAYNAKNKRDIIRNQDETVIGSNINAGNNISLTAKQAASQSATPTTGGNLTLNSTNISSQTGTVALNAAQDVTIGSTTESHASYAEHYSKGKSLLSSKSRLTIDQSQSSDSIGSTISGDTIEVNAGKDINVQASNVVGSNDVNLNATNDITITAAQNTLSESHLVEEKKSGLMSSGGIGFTIGKRQLTTTNDGQQVTNTASTVGSINGDVNINAGKDAHIISSDLIAGRDINVTAQNVTMDAVNDTSANQQTTKFKQTGLTVSLSAPVIDTATAAIDAAKRGSEVKDDRLAAVYALRAGRNAMDAVGDAQKIINGTDVAKDSGIKLSLSLGTSKSQSSSATQETTARGDTLTAGRDINITATGDTNASTSSDSKTGDINMTGVTGRATGDINLSAARDITLQSATNGTSSQSTNKSSSAGVGVAIGADKDGAGISVFANASTAKGNSNGNGITHTETTLSAGNTLAIESGRDTTLKGAIVSGNTVIADVGRNLSLTSEQDTDNYTAKQSSAGGGISYTFGAGGVGGSLSLSKSNTNSNFNSVNEQTAIKAGDGGFTINVGSNTNLKGAVIDSTIKAQQQGNNSLTTGTLTTSDLENQGSYTADSSNMGVNLSGNINTGVNKPAGGSAGSTLKAGLGGLGGSDSGEAHGTTHSAIATADVTITDNATQQSKTGKTADETVATLNRDTQHANGSISNPFDLQKVNEQLEFLQVAGEEILKPAAAQAAKWIGDTFTPDPAHPDQIDPAKVLAHAALGAAMSQLLGTGWQTGATAGALGDVLPQVLSKAFEKDDKGQIKDPEAFKAASAIISAILASSTGGDLAQTINAGMVTQNAVGENFLGHQQATELAKLRSKANSGKELKPDEKKQLIYLEATNQLSDGLLDKYRNGQVLTNSEQKNLNVYLGLYAIQNGEAATILLLKNGGQQDYSYPYGGTSEQQITYMQSLNDWKAYWADRDYSANEQLFRDARAETALYLNTVPNEAFLPTNIENKQKVAVIDALINSPVLATGTYLGGKMIGANQQTINQTTILASQLSDIGASFILPKTSINTALGAQVAVAPTKAFIPASMIPVIILNETVLSRLPEGATLVKTEYATQLNKNTLPNYDASYQAGTKAYTYVTPASGDKFVRVFVSAGSNDNGAGGWVLRESDIKGLSPAQIRDKFSLPQTPTYQVDVNIPANTKIQASTASSALGNNGGGVQFEVVSRPATKEEFNSWFQNPRPLK